MKLKFICLICVVSILIITGCTVRNNNNTGSTDNVGSTEFIRNTSVFFTDNPENSEEISNSVNENTPKSSISSTKENTPVNSLSNDVFGWGFVRKPGGFPIFGSNYTKLLKKYGSIYIGDITTKKIYLTFDEGYENGYTSKILDTLEYNSVKAVFFITGSYLDKNENLVDRMVNEGHVIGNHTQNHPSLPELEKNEIIDEIIKLENTFKNKYGKEMNLIRPPMGEFSEKSLYVSQNLGYRNVFWSFAYDDWDVTKIRGADYAYNIVIDNLHNGTILLLHAVSKDNAEALDKIINKVKDLGYSFGNPEEIQNLN